MSRPVLTVWRAVCKVEHVHPTLLLAVRLYNRFTCDIQIGGGDYYYSDPLSLSKKTKKEKEKEKSELDHQNPWMRRDRFSNEMVHFPLLELLREFFKNDSATFDLILLCHYRDFKWN